ncbi:DUF1835 domain-containing protein [Hyunsoonleella pacifica]|uniref:DUF1835 domain-containing protein n=1 Tax=Hyunsoonleella pacifica TaxID=1080224 RepID=A0A4Q9FQU1_9FLAO|nr:DUF1835 domain-containing protein [Hyunsoonleella pacifica]TBN17740.1 DUF1835 domain-containing protein [Hyunsoonleella pacifica]GGD09355.1 hypothetical protein GCM10011368_09160 [Hyunsoonleella pacifica]
MSKQILHITNGGSLTSYLNELQIEGEIVTWQEMLCEGPTQVTVHSNALIQARRDFLGEFYSVDLDMDKVNFALEQLDNANQRYSEVVLWFEYDLFCHINMLAVINLLKQKKINLPTYLVCSGRVSGSKELKGLPELTSGQLIQHYKDKVKLTNNDLDLAITLWQIYCGVDHNLFKPYIVKSSSFKYLSNCLKAHLERFPDAVTGLNILETNTLRLIEKNDIKSKHHLLGYTLNYQGFYGYGDLQLKRIIDNLEPFYTITDSSIKLNRKAHETLHGQYNASKMLKDKMTFGGVKKLDFQFNKLENKLVKSPLNAN